MFDVINVLVVVLVLDSVGITAVLVMESAFAYSEVVNLPVP